MSDGDEAEKTIKVRYIESLDPPGPKFETFTIYKLTSEDAEKRRTEVSMREAKEALARWFNFYAPMHSSAPDCWEGFTEVLTAIQVFLAERETP